MDKTESTGIGLFTKEKEKWQPMEELVVPAEMTFYLANAINKVINEIDFSQEYDFMTDEGIKFRGKPNIKWLSKWYSKKKGKRYKRYRIFSLIELRIEVKEYNG